MNSAIEKNINYSEKFIQPKEDPGLPKELIKFIDEKKCKFILDMGCGEGNFIWAINKKFFGKNIEGIDISPRRINELKKRLPNLKLYLGDVCNTRINKKFDLIYSSQVIEHVSSDKKMVNEMSRLIKKGGILFCSSVIKKPWAIYKYRNNGKFTLDPTHEKEYRNPNEFLDLFKKDFKLISYGVNQTSRKKFKIKIKIPGFYEIFGIWKRR